MSKWDDTKTTLRDESTSSENVITSEADVIVPIDIATDAKVVNTSKLEFDEDINFEPWEDKTRKNPDPEPPKTRVFDIAAYILERMEIMTTMKLQKLVYYSQAWSLVWDEKPLFEEDIEAWANGPVVRKLFDCHRGMYEISSMPLGNSDLLDQEQRDTVDAILEYYGHRSAQWLIELTHIEDPWVQARKGLPKLERGNRVISLDAMADYYSSLLVEDDGEDEG